MSLAFTLSAYHDVAAVLHARDDNTLATHIKRQNGPSAWLCSQTSHMILLGWMPRLVWGLSDASQQLCYDSAIAPTANKLGATQCAASTTNSGMSTVCSSFCGA